MGQLTDASVILRLGYQAIRRSGLPTEEILTKAGVALNQVETNDRTPLSAQYAFWVAAEEVSKDPDIGLHLGEHLPLYRGQVIEHLFISSENFGEGLKRALAYQRLISDAFHAKLIIEDDRCYLTNGEQGAWSDNLVNRHFSECAMSGVLRFFKFITEGRFQPIYIDFNFSQGAFDEEYFRVYECPVSLGQKETRLYFDPAILDYQLWQAEPELLQLHEQLALEKLQELARYDLVGEVRRAIGSTLESGETTLESVPSCLRPIPVSSRFFPIIAAVWRKNCWPIQPKVLSELSISPVFPSQVLFIVPLSAGPMKRQWNIESVSSVKINI